MIIDTKISEFVTLSGSSVDATTFVPVITGAVPVNRKLAVGDLTTNIEFDAHTGNTDIHLSPEQVALIEQIDNKINTDGTNSDINILSFDTTVSHTPTVTGSFGWNAEDGTMDLKMVDGITQQIGEELYFYGKAIENIANRDVVQIAGVQGDHLIFKKAVPSEVQAYPQKVLGVATENIPSQAFGYVLAFGKCHDVFTTGFNLGDNLYFDMTSGTTGGITNIEPVAPNTVIRLGSVIKLQTGGSETGIIGVRPSFGISTHQLNDVHMPTIADGQTLIWNNTNKRFEVGNYASTGHTHSYTGDTITDKPDINQIVNDAISDAISVITGETIIYQGGFGINVTGATIYIDENEIATKFSTTGHTHTGVYAPVLGTDDNYVTDAEKLVISDTLTKTEAAVTYSPTAHTHNQYLTGETDPVYQSEKSTLALKTDLDAYALSGHTHSQYQATLESGVNIKTINNQSILGSGDLTITITGSTEETDPVYTSEKSTLALKTDLNGYSVTGHTHDDRYFTETEINNLLLGKSDTGHTHNQYSLTGHTHDDRYYTESESDTRFSQTGHTHDALYLKLLAVSDGKQISGFVDGNNIVVNYNWTNRTITLTGNDLSYYWRGVKSVLGNGLTWTSSAHTATVGHWFLYSNDGVNFNWSQDAWVFTDVMVAGVTYNATAAASFAIKETHGMMDPESHAIMHNNVGTYVVGGGKLTAGTYVENTYTDVATTPGFDAAVIKDEDCQSALPVWNEGTYTTMFVSGNTSIFNVASLFPFTNTGATYINVNNPLTGALTAGISNRYYNIYQILVPVSSDADSTKYRMIMLQPQATYTTLLAAQAEDVRTLMLGSLTSMSPEFVIYSRITYTTANQANVGKCTIATNGVTYVVGSKASQVTVAGIVGTNHSALSNLDWLTSGHFNNPNMLAAFDGSGLATEIHKDTYALSGHTHTGVYAPVLGADDNYVTDAEKLVIGDALTKTEASVTYSVTGHNHTGIYQPVMGSDDNYVTDAQLIVIGNTSGTNTGDETTSTIKTKLGITTLSGSNTGDETASSIKTKLGITTLSGSNTGDETKTSLKALLDTEYSLTGHTHDDRYYTETETNNLLATKSDTGHTHSGYQATLESGTNIKTINSQSILGSGDLVVTATEVDPVFTASPAFGITTGDTDNWDTAFGWGNHAGAGYLTEAVADVTYSLTGHTHDDRYYTESESDTRFSQTGHTHTGVYAPVLGVDDNYVTDAQLAVINNTSGTNSGDETVITLKAKLDTVYSLTGHTHSYIPTTTPNAVTATTYTFVIGDAYKLVSFGSGSATSVTVPTNTNVGYAIGTQIDCFQAGAGAVTFAGDTGVTVNSLSGNKTINGQYVGVSLVKTDTNTWLLVGNLKA